MPLECQRLTTGGKGNVGKYIERDARICAAGVPSSQADETVGRALQHYLLKDEVDALMSDAIIPPKPPRPLPPLRQPLPYDRRNAGLNTCVAKLVNPPNQTKFQQLTADVKDTVYQSYWKKPLGQVPDPIPMFPKGFDIHGTTYGKKLPYEGTLYDLVMPKIPLPDLPPSKRAGVQVRRNYCQPAFNPDLTYGYRTKVDPRGIYAKCALTDNRVVEGTAERTCNNFIQADFQVRKQPILGKVLAPNNNISCVPEGYTFGMLKRPENLPECLTFCELNPGRVFFRKCLGHLNSLRKILSTRFLPTFFKKAYYNLKYFDKEKCGWIPKEIVYEYCGSKLIRFDPSLIEPLLCMWKAFDGSKIEYKTFSHILNFKEPLPELPKVPDLHPDCLDFRTTYGEMVKPGQDPGPLMRAGLPSGRYMDTDYPVTPEGYCKAHRTCLPHESDMNSCLKPSILTLVHVSHRDLYAKREPHVVRRVFEAAGDTFTEEKFNAIWEEAKKYHSLGWVCYETFRKALESYKET
ncbi:EF-hand domain-containing family member B-like [Pectinophora gossypiella]|uniref:EF-hand domain-containing family member B-like n=1 Tax=Pectinophora gossypiella TaxID=13191 RepID=UPI00214E1FA5|nr:EF-hand domain-containing family member B-like [Pectinophora gossypiella]